MSSPHDVLATLLNNLKVQERQNRVCTTVAIAIVAETCSPFTVLPALMNEYRVPELNVQNGVLKSLSFMFEYIGEMGKDYIYPVAPLLEDALMDRWGWAMPLLKLCLVSVFFVSVYLLFSYQKGACHPLVGWVLCSGVLVLCGRLYRCSGFVCCFFPMVFLLLLSAFLNFTLCCYSSAYL